MKKQKTELIYHIYDLQLMIELDPEVYSEDESNYATNILEHMSREVHIDKTYVRYEGSRWRNAFIIESGWKHLAELVRSTEYGKKCTDKEKKEIHCSLIAICLTYMYDIMEKYGFDNESIEISFTDNKFRVEYEESTCTNWDM